MAQSQPSAARDQVRNIVPGLIDLSERVLFGEVWERPGLSKRDRSLITCATLIALGREKQLVGHLQRALDNGLTKNELSEVITHLAFYAGWPAAMTAALVAKDVFEKKYHQRRSTIRATDCMGGRDEDRVHRVGHDGFGHGGQSAKGRA